MRGRYNRGYSYRSRRDGNQFFAGLAALLSLYPLYCLIIWVLKLTAPDKIDFMYDTKIDNSLNKGLANWLFDNTVDITLLVGSLVIIGVFIYVHRKLNK